MDVKLKLRVTLEESKKVESFVKASDVSKYNLRCNRNLSEKMMKKDFVYDIRRPLQTSRKIEKPKKQAIVIPKLPRRNKFENIVNVPEISKIRYMGGGGDAPVFPVQRILNYECNFCKEQIATLFSLSTHVKFHCRKYCKKCYWILEDGETMKEHFDTTHQRSSNPENGIASGINS